jgi:hypothetical protein
MITATYGLSWIYHVNFMIIERLVVCVYRGFYIDLMSWCAGPYLIWYMMQFVSLC